ncbi:unnamed protein product [Absidia cylindrospora]
MIMGTKVGYAIAYDEADTGQDIEVTMGIQCHRMVIRICRHPVCIHRITINQQLTLPINTIQDIHRYTIDK